MNTASLHVGRLHSRPDGYEIRLPDGEVVLGPQGEGLTLAQAEAAMDAIELLNSDRSFNRDASERRQITRGIALEIET